MNEAERESYRSRVERAMMVPEISDRLVRGVIAVETLVCGRPGSRATDDEPIFIAGMRLTPEDMDVLVVATGRDGRDCVYVAFDLDDLAAEPVLAVLRTEGETVVVDQGCHLWVAPGSRRAVIVPLGDDEGCYAFRAGSRLTHAANRPAVDLAAGTARANGRVRQLATSPEAGTEMQDHAMRCTTQSMGRGVLKFSRRRLAA